MAKRPNILLLLTRMLMMHVMSALGRFPSAPSRAAIRVTGPASKPDASLW